MVDLEIVRATGGTRARLRKIFTCTDRNSPDWKIRERFECRTRERLQAGITRCARRSRGWQVADIAMDGPLIAKETLPLQLYMQGKIDQSELRGQLAKLNPDLVRQFCTKDDKGELNVSIPRLVDISIGLIRAYVQRRVATQCARFSNLWPYFKYETRSTAQVAKLRGDVLSQRVDIIADQYNYRHFFPQTWRHAYMYARCIIFPTSPWDQRTQWRRKSSNVGGKKRKSSAEYDTVVVREGLDFVNPHPSRVFYDLSAPVANINTDTGPSWIGYWDIVKASRVRATDGYFNRNAIMFASQSMQAVLDAYPAFFNYYFSDDPTVLKMPVCDSSESKTNDRFNADLLYTSEQDDQGLYLTQFYERINPKAEGICDYPHDLWLWRTVAGDDTTVAADWMPSIPAAYVGFNEDDSRDVSMSYVHDMLPFQDQLNNIVSQMLLNMKIDLLQIFAIDEDALSEDMRKWIKETLKGANYFVEPWTLFYSGKAMRELNLDPTKVIHVIERRSVANVQNSLQAVTALLNLVDRVTMQSQAELGQSQPREISAEEVKEIASTTSALASLTSDSVDEQRAAVKRMLYESLVNCGSKSVRLAVKGRYSKATVEAAGFKVDEEESQAEHDDQDRSMDSVTVIGTRDMLVYDYVFNSRDGAERSSSTQSAEILSNLMQALLQQPELAAAIGKKRLFAIINEIFRQSGAGFDLKLEVNEGETDELTSDEVIRVVQELQERLAAIEQAITGGGAAPTGPQPPAPPPEAAAAAPV